VDIHAAVLLLDGISALVLEA